MNKPATPCAVCGQPTRSPVGVCQRTAECRREYQRLYAQNYRKVPAHRERVRELSRNQHTKNREKANTGRKKRYALSGDPRDIRRREIIAGLWAEQAEMCYLCEEPLTLKDAVLEHDHRCCSQPKGYCKNCIRGASHQECNKVAGHSGDDPDRLERIARNLRVKLAEVEERLATKDEQAMLF